MNADRQVKCKGNGNTIFRLPVNFTTRVGPRGQTVIEAYYVTVQQQLFECNEKKTRNVKIKQMDSASGQYARLHLLLRQKKKFFFAKNETIALEYSL